MLELKNVSVGYEKRYWTQGRNLEFHPGMVYGVIGRNGSGKSCLLDLCAGLTQPKTGRVILDGRDLSSCSPAQRRALIGYLSQPSGRRLPEPPKPRREDYSALADLKAVGLASIPARRLSDGERNRLRLAELLARDTPILLLDDPLSGMDAVYRRWFLERMNRVKQQGKTVILSMYDLELAREYCDGLVVIDAGKELYTGTPEVLFQSGILQKVFPISEF